MQLIYLRLFYLIPSFLVATVRINGVSFLCDITVCLCLTEKEQAINRTGIVQEDIQPPGISNLTIFLFMHLIKQIENYDFSS
uniref:Secreted protein n=1 Tax=Pelusios castaneus TaxID=367368 RepID=A0A8C8S4J7_9SAUR